MVKLRHLWAVGAILFLSLAHSEARIPSTAFKGVSKNFQKGFEYYSPTFGIVALDSGLINNLRFYGNFESGPTTPEGRLLWIKDKPLDNVISLVITLFPSPTGTLSCETNSNSSFGKYATVKAVAVLLNYASQVRQTLLTSSPPPLTSHKPPRTTKRQKLPSTPLAWPGNSTQLFRYTTYEKDKEYPAHFQFIADEESNIPVKAGRLKRWINNDKLMLSGEQKQELNAKRNAEIIAITPDQETILKTLETADKNNQPQQPVKRSYQNLTPNRATTQESIQHFVDQLKTALEKDADGSSFESNKIKPIFQAIQASIQEEAKGFYPQYTTEQIILAFFCEKFNAKEDIMTLLQHLDSQIVIHDAIDPQNATDIITPEYLQNLSSNEINHHNFDVDDFYALMTIQFDALTPYNRSLISNGNARPYNRTTLQTVYDVPTYADCVETSIRHLLNLILYKTIRKEFDLQSIEHHVGDHAKTPLFQNFKNFYAQQSQLQANNSNTIFRSLWTQVVGDLNANKSNDDPWIFYVQELSDENGGGFQFNLDPGFINMVNILKRLFGPAMPFTSTDLAIYDANLNQKQQWVAEKLAMIFKTLNPDNTYKVDFQHLRENTVIVLGKTRTDLFGRLKITVSNDTTKKQFSFEIQSDPGHGEIENLEQPQNRVIDISAFEPALSERGKDGTIINSLWLLSPINQRSTIRLPFFYDICYPNAIGDNNSLSATLKKIAGLHEQFDPIFLAPLKSLLTHTLENLSWNDGHVLTTTTPDIINLLDQSLFKDILFKNVKGLSFIEYPMTSLPDYIGNLTSLQELYLSNTNITNLPDSIGNLTSLHTLELSRTRITSLPDSLSKNTNLRVYR